MKTYRDCIKSSVTKVDDPDFKMPLGLGLGLGNGALVEKKRHL